MCAWEEVLLNLQIRTIDGGILLSPPGWECQMTGQDRDFGPCCQVTLSAYSGSLNSRLVFFIAAKTAVQGQGAAGGFLLDLQALASTLGSQARSFALCVPGVNPCSSRLPPFLRPPGR